MRFAGHDGIPGLRAAEEGVRPAPLPASVRKLLGEVLRSDANLDAFCLDHFRAVYDRFSAGMDRVRKTNLLFERVALLDVLDRLRDQDAGAVEENAHLIELEPPAQEAAPSQLRSSAGRAGRVLGRIPKPPRPLVGRAEALRALRDRLLGAEDAGATALHGLPGAGKTTLAAALALDCAVQQHFRGGVLWAALGPEADLSKVLDRWAEDLGVQRRTGRSVTEKARLLAGAVQREAQGAPVLVVLDDVWKWDDARPFLEELAFPGCVHLCTTRDVGIARKFTEGPVTLVGELSSEDAEKLLETRCLEAMRADPEGVRHLARAVGGLPLGLSLIAGTLIDHAGQPRWVEERVAELEDTDERFKLEGGTLRVVVEMSVKTLPPEVQEAFADLGAFAAKPSDFGRDAALKVWDVEEKKGDQWLKKLVDRGLLETAGEDRFTLHQVLADVAKARVGIGRDERMRERHARFYQELVDKAREDWPRLSKDLDQIRYSLETVAKFQSIPFGRDYSEDVGRQQKLESFQKILSTLEHGGDLAAKARTLHNIGCVYRDLGEKTNALEYYERALPIRRDTGDLVGEVHTLYNLASVHRDLGDRRRALERYEQAVPLWRKIGDVAALGRTYNRIGRVHADHRDPHRAREAYDQALAIQRGAGDRAGEATTLFDMASALEKSGEIPTAIAFGAEAVKIAEDLRSPQAAAGRAYLEALRAKQHQIEAKVPVAEVPDPPNSIRAPYRRPAPSDPTAGS